MALWDEYEEEKLTSRQFRANDILGITARVCKALEQHLNDQSPTVRPKRTRAILNGVENKSWREHHHPHRQVTDAITTSRIKKGR